MAAALCLGEALVDFVADVSGVSLIECPGFRKAAGGAPANVAVGLARLGIETAFLGKVGHDPFGRFLERTLADAGVDTSWLRFDAGARTGLAFVSLQPDGERDFVFYRHPSADMRYAAEEIPDAAFDGCRVFHYGSITLIQDPSRTATLDALRRARERSAVISYDPNLRAPLWPNLEQARREMRTAMLLADLVKVSEEEADFLVGEGGLEEQAERILDAGPTLVAITRGAAGAFLACATARARVPGFSVEAVDTTGAGDGFVAGLLATLLARPAGCDWSADEIQSAGRYACAVGAITCTRRGAIPALPRRNEVEAFLARA